MDDGSIALYTLILLLALMSFSCCLTACISALLRVLRYRRRRSRVAHREFGFISLTPLPLASLVAAERPDHVLDAVVVESPNGTFFVGFRVDDASPPSTTPPEGLDAAAL